MDSKISIFWFRRDLRLHDNVGLKKALSSGKPVLPIFIFDSEILEKLPTRKDGRVDFIHQQLELLKIELEKSGSSLLVLQGKPIDVFKQLSKRYQIAEVFCNRDYEPTAIRRDKAVYEFLNSQNVPFRGFKDQVIFEKNEVVKSDGTPYQVFTPYMRAWRNKLENSPAALSPAEIDFNGFVKTMPFSSVTLSDIGFEKVDLDFPESRIDEKILPTYGSNRNIPSIKGTSRLSVHLRFGTISVRELFLQTDSKSSVFGNELIWREFYMMILYHFPHAINRAIKPKYDFIEWENNEAHFKSWCEGKTGYPLVDAGMRELNTTGYMHNRVRMVVASFLCKHLLIDWRWGEAYFAEKLLDFEQSSNIGGWQWAAGSGCDAAPYFRIFNPMTQAEKFDKERKYINTWIPEYGTSRYPKPIIEHSFARNRALERYKSALREN